MRHLLLLLLLSRFCFGGAKFATADSSHLRRKETYTNAAGTICLWANHTANTRWQILFGVGDTATANEAFLFGFRNNDSLECQIIAGGIGNVLTAHYVLVLNQWHHYAIVSKGGGDRWTIYVDGDSVVSHARINNGNLGSWWDVLSNVDVATVGAIASSPRPGGFGVEGTMSDVRVYSDRKTQGYIKSVMYANINQLRDNLIIHLPAMDGAGGTAIDSARDISGNGDDFGAYYSPAPGNPPEWEPAPLKTKKRR